MEAELLAGVIQTDTHKRLQVADRLSDYFKSEENFAEFPEFDRLVAGLATWMTSSNFRVRGNVDQLLLMRGVTSFIDKLPLGICLWYANNGVYCFRNEGWVSSSCTSK